MNKGLSQVDQKAFTFNFIESDICRLVVGSLSSLRKFFFAGNMFYTKAVFCSVLTWVFLEVASKIMLKVQVTFVRAQANLRRGCCTYIECCTLSG